MVCGNHNTIIDMRTIRLFLILLSFVFADGCQETPAIVYDNPYDPNNTSAPLFTPYNVSALYMNDTSMSIIWMDDNLTVSNYSIERRSIAQNFFTVIANRSRNQLEKISSSKTWTVWRYYDTGISRADISYIYRIKIFHNSIESSYSEEAIVKFP